MSRKIQMALLIVVILTACKSDSNYIIPTDFNLFIPDSTEISNGITEKQMEQRTIKLLNTLRINTINREIPNVTVYKLNGQPENLKENLVDKKVIIASSLTCAWNTEGLLNDFPKANKLVGNPIGKSEIVLLILREESDYFNQEYKNNFEEINQYYSTIFLIDSIQSVELNIFGFTRYYISEEQTVLDIGRGMSTMPGYIENEIKRNTVANKGS